MGIENMIYQGKRIAVALAGLAVSVPMAAVQAGDIRIAQAQSRERVPGGVESRPSQPDMMPAPGAPAPAPRAMPPPPAPPSPGAAGGSQAKPAEKKPPAKTAPVKKPLPAIGQPRSGDAAKDGAAAATRKAGGNGDERRPGGIERAPTPQQ
jgi:hypothetical protein